MQITLSTDVLREYPDVAVMGFLASGIELATNLASVPPAEILDAVRERGARLETLADHPLLAPWRGATSRACLKPSTYKSSPEALVRRYMRGGSLATGIAVVDAYCSVSAFNMVPLGAYDLDRIPGPSIELRHARAGDAFVPLGSNTYPIADEIVCYCVESTVLCWNFNHRDSATTCVTRNTSTAVFMGEALTSSQRSALDDALRQMGEMLRSEVAALSPVWTADAARPTAHIA